GLARGALGRLLRRGLAGRLASRLPGGRLAGRLLRRLARGLLGGGLACRLLRRRFARGLLRRLLGGLLRSFLHGHGMAPRQWTVWNLLPRSKHRRGSRTRGQPPVRKARRDGFGGPRATVSGVAGNK